MFAANTNNYAQLYPEWDRVDFDRHWGSTGGYLKTGTINLDYIQLSQENPALLVQALYFWMIESYEFEGQSPIYKLVEAIAQQAAFSVITKKMPIVYGIPSNGNPIVTYP